MPLDIVNVGYDSCNYYALLPKPGSGLLFDCGMPGSIGKMRNTINRNGIAPGVIRFLLVSHFHPDHAGIAQELRDEGMALVVVDGQIPSIPWLNQYHHTRGGAPIVASGDVVIKPDESRAFLSRLGLAGEIIPTPGHSADSISLVLDEGIAFAGDLQHPAQLPLDDAVSRASWGRLRDLGVKMVHPAHGSVFNLDRETLS